MNTDFPILAATSWSTIRACHPKAWAHVQTLPPAPDHCTVGEFSHGHGLELNGLLFCLNLLAGCLPQFYRHTGQEAVAVLDVRELPHPEPLLRILESTALLHPGQSLHVIHNRLPHLLYPRLAERQLAVVTQETDDGTIHLYITHPIGMPGVPRS